MRNISEDVKNNDFAPVYLIYGDEPYLRENYRNQLIKALVAPGDNLNFAYFSGDSTDPEEVISLAVTLPFMAEKRVIHVKDSGFFKKSTEEIAEYIDDPSGTTVIIFDEEDVDKRGKSYIAAHKNGYDAPAERFKDDLLRRWIRADFKRQGKGVDADAVEALIDRVGDEMTPLDMEIKKLASYAFDRETVTKDDVILMVPRSPSFNIFAMMDAIADNRLDEAIGIYYEMAGDKKQSAYSVLGRIESHFRSMLMVWDLNKKGLDINGIHDTTDIKDWLVKKYIRQGQKYSRSRMISVIDSCVKADREIKQGRIEDRLAVELIITNTAAGLRMD
ncbi:MAG: DNA polymerase III subunit delta [Lachnospiraceae bacterium]|nr:DNA polymerase III subunit delta [Lachnospiraceae bacterium]